MTVAQTLEREKRQTRPDKSIFQTTPDQTNFVDTIKNPIIHWNWVWLEWLE